MNSIRPSVQKRQGAEVRLAGQVAAVMPATPSEVTSTLPAGAASGLVAVRSGGIWYTNPLPFTVTRPIQGRLDPPVGLNLYEGGTSVTLPNEGSGIHLRHGAQHNLIGQDRAGRRLPNRGDGILHEDGGSHRMPPPVFGGFDGKVVSGTVASLALTPPGSLVQVFADPDAADSEGDAYLGSGTVGPAGFRRVVLAGPLRHPIPTLTATHASDGSTSEFETGGPDLLLGGPASFGADDGRITFANLNQVVAGNSTQRWIVACSLAPSAPDTATFRLILTNAQAVSADFVNPIGLAAIPQGSFAIESALFTLRSGPAGQSFAAWQSAVLSAAQLADPEVSGPAVDPDQEAWSDALADPAFFTLTSVAEVGPPGTLERVTYHSTPPMRGKAARFIRTRVALMP